MVMPGHGTPIPIWYNVFFASVFVTFIVVAFLEAGTPAPTPKFELGEVVTFKSDQYIRGTVDSRRCYVYADVCGYTILWASKNNQVFSSRYMKEHTLLKLNR